MYVTAVGLTPGGSSTSHIYTQTVHIIQRKENWEVRAVPRLCANYTLAFALQLRRKHGNPSVRVALVTFCIVIMCTDTFRSPCIAVGRHMTTRISLTSNPYFPQSIWRILCQHRHILYQNYFGAWRRLRRLCTF
jgi:hypothetical protein